MVLYSFLLSDKIWKFWQPDISVKATRFHNDDGSGSVATVALFSIV